MTVTEPQHTEPMLQTAPRGEPAGMAAKEFMARFGGSLRTKHVVPVPARRSAWARFAWSIARGRVTFVDRRFYPLPDRSELPAEFIRLDPWEASYLYAVAAQARRGIVEIGRLWGGSTFLLACANKRVPIWSIDIDPRDDRQLEGFFRAHGVGHNVELLAGNSQLDPFLEIGELDFVFVDGAHSHQGCSADLNAFVTRLVPGGHVVLHDCYQGRMVQQAVLDFLDENDLETVRSPYIPAAHWHTSYGSMAHLRTLGDRAGRAERH